jgi:hypothetical protein
LLIAFRDRSLNSTKEIRMRMLVAASAVVLCVFASSAEAKLIIALIIIGIITIIMGIIRTDMLTRAGLLRGAAGTCADKLAVIPGLSTIALSLELATA